MELYLVKQQEEILIRLCQVTIVSHEISLIYKVTTFFKIKNRKHLPTLKYNI